MSTSLHQVLVTGSAGSHFSHLSVLYVTAGVAAFCVAAVTVARKMDLFNRKPIFPEVVEKLPSLADLHTEKQKEKVEKLNFMVEELRIEKERTLAQNEELQAQLKNTAASLEKIKRETSALEKSNLSLVREKEKMKQEKERLVLEASKPLLFVEEIKVEEIKKDQGPKNKKGRQGKPERVSRKFNEKK